MSCSAVCCPSRTTKEGVKDPELSFHTFPKCPEIRNQWIKAIRRKNWEPTKYTRLCSKHFDKSCFIEGLSIKKLKTDAVPTIFENYPVYYKPVVKKRRPIKRQDVIYSGKWKKIQDNGKDGIPKRSWQPVNLLKALSRSRATAIKRLRTIKKLRESKRRLEKRNAELLNTINNLKSDNFIETEYLDVSSLYFHESCSV